MHSAMQQNIVVRVSSPRQRRSNACLAYRPCYIGKRRVAVQHINILQLSQHQIHGFSAFHTTYGQSVTVYRVRGTSRDELTSLGPVRFRLVFRLAIPNPGSVRKVGDENGDGIVFGTTGVWAPSCRRSSTLLAQR